MTLKSIDPTPWANGLTPATWNVPTTSAADQPAKADASQLYEQDVLVKDGSGAPPPTQAKGVLGKMVCGMFEIISCILATFGSTKIAQVMDEIEKEEAGFHSHFDSHFHSHSDFDARAREMFDKVRLGKVTGF